MNSNHSSKLIIALVVLLTVAGSANAVTLSETDAPVTAEVGSSIEATFTFDQLYQNYEEWTLAGETNLTDVTWTVTTFNQADSQIDQASTDGESFEHVVDIEDDVAEVRVEVDASVPEVEDWSYDPPQQFVIASFEQAREGGSSEQIGEDVTLRPYTADSDRARQAIDDADAAIGDAGGDEQAESQLRQAINAFDSGNFDLASELAADAEETARSSEERGQLLRMAAFGLIALVVLGVGGGGLYWYRSNRTGSKL